MLGASRSSGLVFLTVVGQPAEVLLEAGRVRGRVWGVGTHLVGVGVRGGEVGVGGVETRGLGGDAAGNLVDET